MVRLDFPPHGSFEKHGLWLSDLAVSIKLQCSKSRVPAILEWFSGDTPQSYSLEPPKSQYHLVRTMQLNITCVADAIWGLCI